jgi:hypothetical protein
MLFDLTASRGRRRAIKVIYVCLALLMGGGLVLFGIGGNTNGGLFDAFSQDAKTQDNPFKDRVDAAQKRVQTSPANAAAWAELARLRFQNAGVVGYDQNSGTFTKKGQEELRRADEAWQRHLKLAGDKANPTVANSMVQAYQALNKPDDAVKAMEVYLDAQEAPTSQLYAQYAIYAYQASQTRKGDLAAKKAEDLAKTKTEKDTIKSTIEQAKAQVTSAAQGTTTTG